MNEFERLFDVSGLSLDRLRTFLRVVDAGNLTKAAQGDVTKQSQFSRQIKELENFFGVALTRRVGRRIEITKEGNRLALVIRRNFRELDDFQTSRNDLESEELTSKFIPPKTAISTANSSCRDRCHDRGSAPHCPWGSGRRWSPR